ncbi:MAG: hypothetical protein HYR76_00315, partial [Ignavibacteria bacterium]|nr:hypothetical protein [Ignavibacteria bacterium]
MKHRVEFIFFQLFKWAVLALPLKSAQRLGSFIGWLAYILLSSRRHIALDNLQHAFPEKSEAERRAIALGSFRNYGITLMELLWLPNLDDTQLRKLITPANLEVIEQGYSRGKGMVMLSGHFGNWELIAFGMAYLSGHPFTIIVQTQSNRLVDEVINRHRCLLGNTVIP